MSVRRVLPGERGVDFAFSKPPPSRLKELGYTFVVGYISTNPGKDLLHPQDYLNAGLAVVLVFELYAERPNGGAAFGTQDGTLALSKLVERKYPTQIPMIVAFDTNTVPTNITAHKAYFDAFAKAVYPYRIGAYEDTDLAKVTNAEDTIDWLPLAWSWSGLSQADARARAAALGYHVFQEKGFIIDNQWAVDPNIVVRPFTAWALEDEVSVPIVTNSEPRVWRGNTYPAGVLKYVVMDDGRPRRASGGELIARGFTPSAALGTPWTNADFDDAGGDWTEPTVTVTVPPITIPPINVPAPVVHFPPYTITSTATPQ